MHDKKQVAKLKDTAEADESGERMMMMTRRHIYSRAYHQATLAGKKSGKEGEDLKIYARTLAQSASQAFKKP